MNTIPYVIEAGPLRIIPALHYTLESSCAVRWAFNTIKPDCVAVELPETLERSFFCAVERLPDISVISSHSRGEDLYYLVEPVDPAFEALRCAQEHRLPAYCIDLDVTGYPQVMEPIPDSYAIHKIGLKNYYEAYSGSLRPTTLVTEHDKMRELYLAKRLKELSFSYEKILVVVGMSHVQNVLYHFHDTQFPQLHHAIRTDVLLSTVTQESCRQVMATCGWTTCAYEQWREKTIFKNGLDQQKNLLHLLKAAILPYEKEMRTDFPSWGIELILKFCRKWAHLRSQLLPTFFQLITAARSCIDHNYAYEVWKLATDYPYLKNIDSLPELPLTPQDVWKGAKEIHFYLKNPSEKGLFERRLAKEHSTLKFFSPSPFAICSYPPEDSVIEQFGEWLKKKGMHDQLEENTRSIPFSTSLEEGVDTKETIRHWTEKKLYVKKQSKPPGKVGSCVVIFDEDVPKETESEKYPWKLTWLGEHEQESDMAFYSTHIVKDIVGPGIARCEYGGLMLTSPPRRVFDVWYDPDYAELPSKADVLLAAAIDYAVKPVIVYAAPRPPSLLLKRYASRQAKRVLYMPLSQFSPRTLKSLRTFHVLDSYEKRKIAGDYIT